MEESNVHLKAWPEETALLRHQFDLEEPCPISIIFEPQPANVVLSTNRDSPLDVNMAMRLSAEDAIPVCISICEPICAKSDYNIGIDFNGQSLANISVTGTTVISNCAPTKPQ